ncbi:MAG TPA: hypothetical protein V6C72_05695, partial [Chroococcales cyanobacterium]
SSAITEYKEFVRLSEDQNRVMKAKQRIAILEQKIGPGEADPIQVKPSPFMRTHGMGGQEPGGYSQGPAGGPGSAQPPPVQKDSGF